jgi:hypothetical protein
MRWPHRLPRADCPALRAWLCRWLRHDSPVATRPGRSVPGMCLLERQVAGPPCPAGQEVNGRVGQRRSLAGMYQRGHAVLRPGIWHVAIAAGTTQSEAILGCDSETIAWRDWDVTATNWIAWKWYSQPGIALSGRNSPMGSIRKELSDG